MGSHSRLSHLLLLFTTATLLLFPATKPDLAADKATLLALQAALGGTTSLWNASQLPDPCKWKGITCDHEHVTEIHLPGDRLSGRLPPNTIGNLTHLRFLSLRRNNLSGQLPSDIGLCSQLGDLHLEDNQFSGRIPGSLFRLINLVRLNLARNGLSGEISPDFKELINLKTLYLERNQLTGSIPELPLLDKFNASYNRLNGRIPRRLEKIHADAFYGNSLCGAPLQPCPGDGSQLSGGAIAGVAIGSVGIGVALILLILLILRRKGRGEKEASVAMLPAKQSEFKIPTGNTVAVRENGGSRGADAAAVAAEDYSGDNGLVFFGKWVKVFDMEELLVAPAEVLGRGTFGTTYKAVLDGGREVVVKRLKSVCVTEREFRERVEGLGEIIHGNLFPIRAYYCGRDEKLLLYDYTPLGSLSALLHGTEAAGRAQLSWEVRSSIALGAARGIEHLHAQGVSHGSIRSSNILLSKYHGARVADFGIAQLVCLSSAPTCTGYRAPEAMYTHRVSEQADVYSFGILLFELLTGKAPTDAHPSEEGIDLPKWVESMVQEKWIINVFDLELLKYRNNEEQMVKLLNLAILCTSQWPDRRPTMTKVTRQIEVMCQFGQ